MPARGRFVARSAAFVTRAVVEVRQDGTLLWREPSQALVPGRSVRLAASWVEKVDPTGPEVRVALAG